MKHLESSFDGNNAAWRYFFLFIFAFFAANTIGSIPLVVYVAMNGDNQELMANIASGKMDFGPYTLELNIFPFIVGLLAFWLLVKPIHKRSMGVIINGGRPFRWNRLFSAAAVWLVLSAIYLFVSIKSNPDAFDLHNTSSTLIRLVVVSLLFLPFQCAFEEVLFRGYLMQGFTTLAKNRWVPLIVTSLGFALMHGLNPEVKAYGFLTAMPQYIVFGLLFGIVTIMDDGIEASIGLHAANNAFLSIMVTNKDSALQTPALFEQTIVDPWLEFACMVVMSAVVLFILPRLFKWGNYSLLLGKVEKPES